MKIYHGKRRKFSQRLSRFSHENFPISLIYAGLRSDAMLFIACTDLLCLKKYTRGEKSNGLSKDILSVVTFIFLFHFILSEPQLHNFTYLLQKFELNDWVEKTLIDVEVLVELIAM